MLLDLTAALGIGSTMAVVGSLLPAMARAGGLDPMGLAGLAALPFLASLIGILAGRIGPRTPAQLAAFRAIGSAGLLLIVLTANPALIAVTVFGYWTAMSLGAPTQQRLWAGMYPAADRGRLLGTVGSGRSLAAMAALLAFTLASEEDGWLPIIGVVAVVGVVSATATSRLHVRGAVRPTAYGPLDSVAAVVRPPAMRRITVAQLIFGAGMIGGSAFMALVQVDRLGLGFSDVALAGLAVALATTSTFGLWGRLASRTGSLTTMTLGTILGTLSLAAFALAQDVTMLLLASLLLGAQQAAVDASWPLLIADHAEAHEQAAAAAGLGAIMGVRGLLMPFIFMAPLHAGLIDETGGLLICMTVAAAGALMYVRLSRRTRRAASPQSSPASALTPASSSSGWPVIRRSRLMRSTIAGWVLKRPLALLSSFLTGLTT
jgi:MFS family permease